MPIANPPKRNIGKPEFCQCSDTRLNGWPVHIKDQYCSECGAFLYSLDFLSSSIDQKCELTYGVFLLEPLGNDIQIRTNLQISKKTTASKKDTINFNDACYSFCKEAEIIIEKPYKQYFISLREDFAKKGTLSFSIDDPKDKEELVQQASGSNLKTVLFKCCKNRNLPGPRLNCAGILGPFPTEGPFEILISGESPELVNGCLKWKFTAPNLNRLDISWKARYPFRLIGAYWDEGKPIPPFTKKDYVTGDNGQFLIKLKDNGQYIHPFKFIFYLEGVNEATSIFEYSCLVEKANSDLISLIPANTDYEIPIKSGGTIPYEAIIILKKSDYDLQITDIQIKDTKSCVKLTTSLPLSVKKERTPISFSIQTSFFDRVKDNKTLYLIEVVISDNKGNKWFQKLNPTMIREKALDHYLAIDWGTTNTCCTIFDPMTGTDKQLTDHGKKNIHSISSRFAIRKVDIENEKCDLIVGSADSLKTDFQEKPECIISSLKRKFYNNPKMSVYDADSNELIITTMDLAVQYLQALIIAIEEKSSFEFKKIGFSYPTKIEKKHYTKLIEMLEKLEQSLQKVKPGVTVTILPNYLKDEKAKNQVTTPLPNFKEDKNNNLTSHTPDEACSVAIEYCNSIKLKISDGPQILVVYDFGGGTIDSAVIKIFHDGEKFCSRLIGISGTHQFGGDDITNAIVQLVREKIFKIDPKVYIPVFDESNNKDSTDIGKKNRARLFDIMEKHKKDFKTSEDKEIPISFLRCLTQIKSEDGKSEYEHLFKDGTVPTTLQKSNLQFFPSEIYDWEIGQKNSALKIRQIIQRSVDDLQNICDIENVKPSKIILAGQGCNLPLVRDIFNKRFPGLIDFDKDKSKTRLSVGLSHFLNSHDTNNDGIYSNFYPMPFVNHFALGFKNKSFLFEKLIPIGNLLHASNIKHGIPFPLELPCDSLDLFRKNYRDNSTEKIGTFDFRNAENLDENYFLAFFKAVKITQRFPEGATGIAKGLLFFCDFKDIFLVFNWKTQYYGCFKLKFLDKYLDLQEAVQGR